MGKVAKLEMSVSIPVGTSWPVLGQQIATRKYTVGVLFSKKLVGKTGSCWMQKKAEGSAASPNRACLGVINMRKGSKHDFVGHVGLKQQVVSYCRSTVVSSEMILALGQLTVRLLR